MSKIETKKIYHIKDGDRIVHTDDVNLAQELIMKNSKEYVEPPEPWPNPDNRDCIIPVNKKINKEIDTYFGNFKRKVKKILKRP